MFNFFVTFFKISTKPSPPPIDLRLDTLKIWEVVKVLVIVSDLYKDHKKLWFEKLYFHFFYINVQGKSAKTHYLLTWQVSNGLLSWNFTFSTLLSSNCITKRKQWLILIDIKFTVRKAMHLTVSSYIFPSFNAKINIIQARVTQPSIPKELLSLVLDLLVTFTLNILSYY